MARTLSEGTLLQSVVETALGEAAATGWRRHQPNTIDRFGALIKKITRDPIGAGRMAQQGDVVDVEAPVEWTGDLTKDLIDDFVEGILMARAKHNGGTGVAHFVTTEAVDGGAAADSFKLAGGVGGTLQAGTLIRSRGLRTAQNNALLEVAAGSAADAINVPTGTLAAELVGTNYLALVEVAGFRGQAGDLKINAANNLESAGAADFTTMGLYVGQWIWVGGTKGGANAFADQPTYRGFAQIDAIAATELTLKRRSWAFVAADAGAGKRIDVYFGRWVRNTNAQSADYLELSYTFEITFPNLGGVGTPEYEYAFGQYLSAATINLPAGDKATVDLSFVGQNTVDPDQARKAGANAANVGPLQKAMFNTSAHMMRLRMANVDETGLTTDIKSLKLMFTNNVSREVVLGYQGAKYLNVGDFGFSLEGEFLFTSHDMVAGVRNNIRCQLEVGLRNGDGGLLIDVPSVQLDSADRKFTANMSVTLDAKVSGFEDPVYGYVAGITIFPYLPAA